VGEWTGSSWLRIETGGRDLWMRKYTSRFHKMWGISWQAANQLASQEGLCSMEKVMAQVCYNFLNRAYNYFRKNSVTLLSNIVRISLSVQ
jgi:hypothetical protein